MKLSFLGLCIIVFLSGVFLSQEFGFLSYGFNMGSALFLSGIGCAIIYMQDINKDINKQK